MTQSVLSHRDTERSDSSESETLDEALARIARVEMALAASGGTLHDVNNLLTVLSGNLYLLTETLREDPTSLTRCRSARDTAQRAAALIRELLTFASTADASEKSVCPATLLENLDPVLRRSLGGGHALSINLRACTWRVTVSVAQLESAIANLVLNASQALNIKGRIDIDVANISACGALPDVLTKADYVRISVRDDGAGIAPEQLPRVMEPLFTSKPKGQGSGMGLTMVSRFAKAAGGDVTIESTEGQGTDVSIWLPRASEAAITASLTMPISTLPSGDESVLVVLRDESTATIIQQLLEALGYSITATGERAHVASILKAKPDIALVIGANDAFDCEWRLAGQRHDRQFLGLVNPGEVASGLGDASIYLPVSVPELAQSVRHLLDRA